MRLVDRDGEPIEVSNHLAGEVAQYPVPDDVPDEILMTRSSSSTSRGLRHYHEPDPEDPMRPNCRMAAREDFSWNRYNAHGIPGNYPACPDCWPEVADEEVVTA